VINKLQPLWPGCNMPEGRYYR